MKQLHVRTSYVVPRAFYILSLLMVFIACNSDPRPRPKGYFNIDFPEKKYVLFDEPGYPYTFEYPVYGKVLKDSTFFEAKAENPYWVNLDFPELAGRIHISYKTIGEANKFDELVQDAFKMTSKHSHTGPWPMHKLKHQSHKNAERGYKAGEIQHDFHDFEN